MLGTIVNALAIIAGGLIGLIVKKGLPEKMADTLMKGLGLCTLFLGSSGSLKGENSLILIISIVVGTLIGEGIDLEDKVNRLGQLIERIFSRGQDNEGKQQSEKVVNKGNDEKNVSVAEGFVTASLLFCVGAMAIVGAMQSGLTGNHEMLFNKSMIDFASAIIFASTLGVGVICSAVLVFVYQGAITVLAQWISPLLTDSVVNEMTCVGSVIIIGLALNMLGVTKLRVMNFVPAIFLPIILCLVL
uniref:DUF554 domain-containing protein n=1 Tax=Acetatifactor sp. TaxID=1872090 RepID=UPI0040568794